MFYAWLKWYARLAIRIYCKKIIINKPDILQQPGPLLLACNHPNSFLDGMILTTLFDHPLHSLARGDVFRHPLMNRFLRSIQLLPVYRTSEGVENLNHNYTTFAACRESFEKGENVLIFSEGACENEWHLRPLKKGTARLATSAWKAGIDLKVIPTALNYSSFRNFGKEVHLFFGEELDREAILSEDTGGRQLLAFNEQLDTQLSRMVYEISPDDAEKRKKLFGIRIRPHFFLLLIPALAGWLLHVPLFYGVRSIAFFRFRKSDHYDSVMTALLLILYPFYLLVFMIIASVWLNWSALAVLLVLPATAWCAVQVKYQLDI